ncbi:hypothetical protein [Aminobacter sp. MSH1]|uniref:hypothetical protein n=1 Tax=Aminobacter sp. MSH1 TaxID=374606 RepID=UPI000D3C22E6|nr:hypothetical protein [Aminobacter sp. MSH1]
MTTFYEKDGVKAWEYAPERQPGSCFFGVTDSEYKRYRITFWPTEDNQVSVNVDAEWSDAYPGQLGNFTHDPPLCCSVDDTLSISDEGLFTALARARAATSVDLRLGVVMQLPVEYVPPIRAAIAKAREAAKQRAVAAEMGFVPNLPTILSADEHIASDWWLGRLPDDQRMWMAKAGNSGIVLDAWRIHASALTATEKYMAASAPFGWDQVEA